MDQIFSFVTSHFIGLAETIWIVYEVRKAGRKRNGLDNKSNPLL